MKIVVENIFMCLVQVKYFSENKYFSEMLFSGKKNIFKYFIAFQKMFWSALLEYKYVLPPRVSKQV